MSIANTNAYAIFGIEYLFWAALNGTYPYGVTGTLANGANAGMGSMRGVQDLNIADPATTNAYVLGNNGVVTSFKVGPQELPTGTLTLGVLDQIFAGKSNGVKVYTDGDWDEIGGGAECFDFSDICLVANSPANAQEAINLDEAGWAVTEIYKIQNQATILAQMQSATAVTFPNNITCKRTTRNLAGRVFTAVDDGKTSFVYKSYPSPYPVTYHTLIGNASVDDIVLDYTPAAASAEKVQVWINGVKKTYTTDYTVDVATKTVSLVAVPASGAKVVIKYQFLPTC